jgi:DNA polymerase-3 subunit epsilon
VTVPSFLAAYVDTETTGLSSRQDRIIEVAIVLAWVDGLSGCILEVLDEYHALQDPGIRIPTMATMIHGITNEMVRGEEIDRQRVQALLSAATIVLAHNSGFDKGFVAQIAPEAGECLWGCTCRGIPWKKLFPALGSTSLQTLASYFPHPMRHRAPGSGDPRPGWGAFLPAGHLPEEAPEGARADPRAAARGGSGLRG